jgi:hypothetical protein
MDVNDNAGYFRYQIEELGLTPVELASRMRAWGDHRNNDAIIRSIQRMSAGDTAISGEMLIVVNVLNYLQHLEDEQNSTIDWINLSPGTYNAKAGDFTITLSAQTKGRWHISIVHQPTGYSHPWPSWQNDLEAAKRKAIFSLSDARRHIFEWQRRESSLIK